MSRLTKEEVKECATSVVASNIGRGCGKTLTSRILSELLEYKCIEEELGIDIKTFIKALLNGIYVKVDGEIIDFTNSIGWLWKFDKKDSWYDEERPNEYYFAIIYRHVNEFYMKDYGKTWALTREELENYE